MTDYRIRRLGHLGDGMADGPVYAPGTLAGELVTGRRDGDRLTDIRILSQSADRVVPSCRHYSSCGGCRMQHMADPAVLTWKCDIVRTACRAQGLSVDSKMLPPHVSPPNARRRATLAARRTRAGAMAGFYGRRSEMITEIPECRLLHPRLLASLPAARALAVAGASRKASLRISATLSRDGLDLAVTGGKPGDGPLRVSLAQISGSQDLARLTWNAETVVTHRPPSQDFDGIRVVPPPDAFLQATEDAECALRADVEGIVGSSGPVVDLFAGCGTFALPLSRHVAVHAVEGEAAMTEALTAGWRGAQGLRRVTTETRDLFRKPLIADELAGFGAAVIDPPRAGAEAQIAQLARSGIPTIAYVSCNPVTFARDAATLSGNGYRLTRMRVVDQFRWSVHVELVAGFRLDTG